MSKLHILIHNILRKCIISVFFFILTGISIIALSEEYSSIVTAFEGVPMGFVYSDSMLENDANVFSSDLAKASIGLAVQAYGSLDSINALMSSDELGYTKRWSDYYNFSASYSSNDFVAYSIYTKEVEFDGDNYILYCIPVRGTPSDAEWYSNFHMEEGEAWHTGFSLAAGEVKDRFVQMTRADSYDDAHTKLWITGHSRGAAVANLVAGHLSNGEGTSIPRSNIFCYTYACPNVGRSGLCNTSFHNIRNFNNTGDVVPIVPLSSWGYGRYGETIQGTVQMNDNIRKQFANRTGTSFNGMADVGYYERKLSEVIKTQEDAFSDEAQVIFTFLAWFMSGQNGQELYRIIDDKGWDIAKTLLRVIGGWANLTGRVASERIKNDIQQYFNERQAFRENVYSALKEYKDEGGSLTDYLKEKTGYSFAECNEMLVSFLIIPSFIENESYEAIMNALENERPDPMAEALEVAIDLALYNMDAIIHGHDWKTYLCWMDSDYYGYRGYYQSTTVTDPDLQGVTSIGSECFSRSQITIVTIPESIQYLGPSSFSFCSNLQQVTLHDQLEEIPERCFFGCSALPEIIIPNSVYTLGMGCFTDCPGLTSITMPIELYGKDRSTNMNGYDAFSWEYYSHDNVYGSPVHNKSTTTNVETLHFTVSGSGIMLDQGELYTANGFNLTIANHSGKTLKTVIFDEGVKRVGDRAFAGCTALETVLLASTTEAIGDASFSGCTSLTQINMPSIYTAY